MPYSLLPASYGVSGACQSRSFCISTQPVQDYLASPCSTSKSSHSESLSVELLLQDLVADACHGIQKKHLKVNKHEVDEHTAWISSCKDLHPSANGRHQAKNCVSEECIGSEGSVSLSDHLLPSTLKFPDIQDTKPHLRSSDLRSNADQHTSLQAHLASQTLDEAFAFIEGIADEPLPTEIFIPILKSCRKHKALDPAKRLHLHMCNHGFESHGLLKNILISIYVDSGCVDDAQRLVSRQSTIDQHSWNTLIQGYLISGESKQAFRLYKEMEGKFVPCRRYILMALLQTFASEQCMGECQELHAKIVERELESDRFFCNTLIDMYVKCESLIDAQEVFNEHPCKDIVMFSTLITGYTEQGHFEEVLRCWDQVVTEGLDPDISTLVCCLKACANIQDLDKGREIHTTAVKQMLEKHSVVGNCLIGMYAKCGALSDSQAVFDKLPVRDVVSWSTLIVGYADQDLGEKALKQYDQMQLSGVILNDVTFLGALKACISVGAVEKGQAIHAEIAAEEYESYPLVSSVLVDMYSKFGLLSEARFLFATLPVRNVIAWTALIEAYADHGLFGRALQCFQSMKSQGLLPNRVTFLCILKACCSRKLIEKGRDMHFEITSRGFEGDLFIGSALVDMYAKCDSPSEAQFVFDRLPRQCVIPWTALLAGCVKHGQGEEAFNHFEQMKQKGVLPETATYLYLLKACGDETSLEVGQIIHMEIICRGFEKYDRVSPALVYMYAKNASLSEAQSVFDKLQSRHIDTWQILMGSFVKQGLGEAALAFLKRMEMEGVVPEVTTWVLCMKACQCTGLIKKVYELHSLIVKQGFERHPSIGHLIVKTYAFHGVFEDSKVLFDSLPDSDLSTWNKLISRIC